MRIRSPTDFWTGVIYLLIGTGGHLIARRYSFGTAAQMGPGYFPFFISALLAMCGLASIGVSFTREGKSIDPLAWKPLFLVVGSVVIFAFLVAKIGLVLSLAALILISAAASDRFRFEWMPMLGLFGLIVFCSVVFVIGLGVPLPLVGPWILGILPSSVAG